MKRSDLPSLESFVGQRFDRLTVVAAVPGLTRRRGRRVLCRCDCGAERILDLHALKSGNTKSCGCRQVDSVRARNRKHGQCLSPTHRSWRNMLARVTSPRHKHYFGRVTVCERWHVFANFLEDMGERPPGRSIDRIDGSKGYEPGNCRWATKAQQSQNSSAAILSPLAAILVRQMKRRGATIRQIAEAFGVSTGAIAGAACGKTWRDAVGDLAGRS